MSFPSNWRNVKFGDIAQQIVERIDDPQKSGYNSYIGLEHIESEQINIQKYGDAEEVKSSKFLCQKGDIIFGRRRAYLRKLAVCDRDSLVSTDAMVIRPKKEVIKEYLILMMQTDYFWEKAISLSAGSLSPRVKWRELSTIEFYLPPLDIQKKISDILWSIQGNLEKIEKLIQITEKLKKGLLEQLLTKGIGHKKFKKTEIGMIPEEWDVKLLGSLFRLERGLSYNSKGIDSEGIPMINLGTIKAYGGFTENGLKFWGGKYNPSDLINKGDLVIANTDITRNLIVLGYPCRIPSSIKSDKILFSHHIYAIRDLKFVESDFLEILLKSPLYHEKIVNFASGTTVFSVSKKDVYSIKIPLPTKSEREAIVKKFKLCEENLLSLNNLIKNIKNLRNKLSNELLSGNLRLD